MEQFIINYRNINIKIKCDPYIKNIVVNHLYGHVNFIDNCKNETYTLVISDNLKNAEGIKNKMVDKWFDYASLDCYIDNINKVCYVTNFKTSTQEYKNSLIQYFVSNFFYRFLEIEGYIGIHSSCVEIDNKGILFVADRFSGKTNCMLNLVHSGFNYITNKEIALKKINDDIIGYGIAQSISIRLSPSFCCQPQNYKYVKLAKERGIKIKNKDELEGNNIHLTDCELAEINNVKQVMDVPIKYIVKPVYDPTIKNIKIEEMNREQIEDLILSQYLPLVHETKDFLKNVSLEDVYVDKKFDMIKELFEIPNFICYQNEKTTEEFVKKVKKILL